MLGKVFRLQIEEEALGNGPRAEQAHVSVRRLQSGVQQRERLLRSLQTTSLAGLRDVQALRSQVHVEISFETSHYQAYLLMSCNDSNAIFCCF